MNASYMYRIDFQHCMKITIQLYGTMTKLRSGRKITAGGDEDSTQKSAAQMRSQSAKQNKRSADESSAENQLLTYSKKAKPSICKAAEELMCPILQGLPIDPVIAEDVSQGVSLRHAVHLCAYNISLIATLLKTHHPFVS